MKKILIFLLILSNLTFGAQKMSLDSKEIDKILEDEGKIQVECHFCGK